MMYCRDFGSPSDPTRFLLILNLPLILLFVRCYLLSHFCHLLLWRHYMSQMLRCLIRINPANAAPPAFIGSSGKASSRNKEQPCVEEHVGTSWCFPLLCFFSVIIIWYSTVMKILKCFRRSFDAREDVFYLYSFWFLTMNCVLSNAICLVISKALEHSSGAL